MAAAASNFSSLLFLTLLGFSSIFGSSYGFPYHGQRLQGNVQRAAPSDDMGAAFGAQQIPPPQQQTSNEPLTRVPLPQQPESTDLQQPNGVQQPQQPLQPEPTDLQQPNGVQQPQPETTNVQQPSPAEPIPAPESSSNMGISENVEPIPAPESTDVEPIYGMQQQQSPPAESVEISIFEPMDNETDSAQAIVETLTEAERSHLISYFLCEMCKELQVSMCMRICNGETDGSGSGAEIESSGAEVEGSGQESGENGGETIIIVVEEGSGQESSNGSEGSGQESSNGSEGSGQESSNGSEGSGESEESGEN